MAILSKIRERSMFLILIIGLALFAFVLDPSTLGDFFSSNKVNEIGNINGETITRQEFAEALENYQAINGSNTSEMQASKVVWNNLVKEKIYTEQLEHAGITIGEQDIMNSLYQAPSIQNDPRFQTEGLFDKDKLIEYLATIKEDPKQKQIWNSWQNYISSIGNNLKKTTYDNLVNAGLGASLKEGKAEYLNNNTKITAQYVYVPYRSIADSLITLKKSDIQNYIDNHKDDFKVEESRDIKYVKFTIKPTAEDETTIKNEVAKLIENEEEYSNVTKGVVTIKGLKNATDYKLFLDENKSDLALDENFKFKNDLFTNVSEELLSKNIGEVFGPYKDKGFYKISKVIEAIQMPDSVKASHILIPFFGTQPSGTKPTKSEENAKKQADSLLNVIKKDKSKFADLAKEFSSDKGSGAKGGSLNWFTYNRMVPEFRDYCFSNKKGDIGVIKSQFGFHIIKIEDQKNKQKAVKLVTFGRQILASEVTENNTFQQAETFALELSKESDLDKLASTNKLSVRPAIGLKALDENVVGLGKQRQIVSWAFNKDIKVGDYKRFDIDEGYVVAILTGKTKKGLLSVEKATAKIRPLVVNEKKAVLIADKMNGKTLADIASSVSQKVRTASAVTLRSPTFSGVGSEPKIVGAMLNAKNNKLYNKINGEKGVFVFVVSKKELPTTLPNYDTYRKHIADKRRNQSVKMYEAIKKSSKIEDNRTNFYGIE